VKEFLSNGWNETEDAKKLKYTIQLDIVYSWEAAMKQQCMSCVCTANNVGSWRWPSQNTGIIGHQLVTFVKTFSDTQLPTDFTGKRASRFLMYSQMVWQS